MVYILDASNLIKNMNMEIIKVKTQRFFLKNLDHSLFDSSPNTIYNSTAAYHKLLNLLLNFTLGHNIHIFT